MNTNLNLTPEEKWENAWLDDAFIFYKVMTKITTSAKTD